MPTYSLWAVEEILAGGPLHGVTGSGKTGARRRVVRCSSFGDTVAVLIGAQRRRSATQPRRLRRRCVHRLCSAWLAHPAGPADR